MELLNLYTLLISIAFAFMLSFCSNSLQIPPPPSRRSFNLGIRSVNNTTPETLIRVLNVVHVSTGVMSFEPDTFNDLPIGAALLLVGQPEGSMFDVFSTLTNDPFKAGVKLNNNGSTSVYSYSVYMPM
ncbi:hypothetical protein VTN96DRAFT_1230 [Rasamsonia emersonii]